MAETMSAAAMYDELLKAWKVSTPLISIRTSDQQATIANCKALLLEKDKGKQRALIQWDMVSGLAGLNDLGKAAIVKALREASGPDNAADVIVAADALSIALFLPERTLLFMINAHMSLEEKATRQAIFNLRDRFKDSFRCLILLGPAFQLPDEIRPDVIPFDEPLPDRDDIVRILTGLYESTKVALPGEDQMRVYADELSGLSSFAVEQVGAIALTKQGLDAKVLRRNHHATIEQTPGLKVYTGKENFDSIGGLAAIKNYCRKLIGARKKIRVVVYLDELEKMLGGQGDTSGVSQGLLGYLLSFMQDNEASGLIGVGFPGTGKSLISKALGNEAKVPTIQFDIGGTKNSLVGSSEANMRQALKVIKAVGEDGIFVIASCNGIAALPPELKRRFNSGTYFFDLPTEEERDGIWKLYRSKYETEADDPRPDDTDWTGAEISTVTRTAWNMQIPLREAAHFIVPVAVSMKEGVEKLRLEANARYLSTSEPGFYRFGQASGSDKLADAAFGGGKRKLEIGE